MAKPELGTKRICGSCGAKFYDLGKDPILCPKCGTVFEVVAPVARSRPDARAMPAASTVPEPELETTDAAEFVSLEEADAETEGKKSPVADVEGAEDDIEVADDETMDDDAFIEETEEGDADVTDIIGDAGDKEEES
ncbi:MAG TPA: TIGR02300 family protein [Pseudorhodoplanes sp.]|nr:TIGR02300 family protein [Pseudorhodoplanes sp.]